MAAHDNPQTRERRIAVRAGLFVALGARARRAGDLPDRQGAHALRQADHVRRRVRERRRPRRWTRRCGSAACRSGGCRTSTSRPTSATSASSSPWRSTRSTASACAATRWRASPAAACSATRPSTSRWAPPRPRRSSPATRSPTGISGDISSLLKASGEIIDNAVAITRDLRGAIAAYTDPELRKDVAASSRARATWSGRSRRGRGPLHARSTTSRAPKICTTLLANARADARRGSTAPSSQAEAILLEVQQGHGPAHALIYDQRLAQGDRRGRQGRRRGRRAIVHDAKKSPERRRQPARLRRRARHVQRPGAGGRRPQGDHRAR